MPKHRRGLRTGHSEPRLRPRRGFRKRLCDSETAAVENTDELFPCWCVRALLSVYLC
jgi:hypothetical protein